ncbi:hypothetical protein B296_00005779 [Ensete ventricosum]|uniref:Uncharacterized protein n=1 Tax=Ensete ventricosum TaxID=4639 RepID=A0A427APK5_ENSVE|nr:hypothetical protein B296_00005779 [Ensete ventricosum]
MDLLVNASKRSLVSFNHLLRAGTLSTLSFSLDLNVVGVTLWAMPATASRLAGIPCSKALAPPHDADLRSARKPQPRRRIRNPAFPGAAVGARPRKGGAGSGGRRSGPATPLLRWKFNEKPAPEPCRKVDDAGAGEPPPPLLPRVSARKLAAGIWHLRPLDSVGGLRDGEGRPAPPRPEVR